MDPEVQVATNNSNTPGSSFSKVRVLAFSVIIILVLSAIALTVWFTILNPRETSDLGSTTPTVSITVPDVKSDKDLEKLEKEVNAIDISGMSKELDANDKDSKDF